jgi:hypothetical protein
MNLHGEIGAHSYPHHANYSTSEAFLTLPTRPIDGDSETRIAPVLHRGMGRLAGKKARKVICGSGPGPNPHYRPVGLLLRRVSVFFLVLLVF